MTIKAKLLIFFLSLVVFAFVSSFLGNYYLQQKEKELTDITRKIERANNLVLEDIRTVNNFFSNETIDPAFFKTKKSAYLDKHAVICGLIDSSLVEINKSQARYNFELGQEISHLDKQFIAYRASANDIVKYILLRGFKDFGVEGGMRTYAHQLENYEKEIGQASILELRRHEKDFIIRQEDTYVLKHRKLADNIRLQLMANKNVSEAKKKEILEILNQYTSNFSRLVLYDKKIGIKTQSGIKKKIDNRIEDLSISFRLIRAKAELRQLAGLHRIQAVYFSMWALYLVISIVISLYLSGKFSREVNTLKNRVVEFVKSDFTKKNPFHAKISKYEMDELSINLNLMEKHISKLMVELKETNKELQTLINKASYDLQVPVMHLQELVNKLKDEHSDYERTRGFSMVDATFLRLNNIVEQLALVNIIKEGDIENEEVDIKEIVNKVVKSFKASNETEHIVFSAEYNLKKPLYSDARLIKIVLSNLIDNSIRYANKKKSNPFVKIRVSQDMPEMIRIDVQDNGVGIQEEIREKIFDMFFRDTHLSDSSGLGLHVVQNVLKRLQGAVKLESQEGKGTTFSIYLPNSTQAKPVVERVKQLDTLMAVDSELVLNYV